MFFYIISLSKKKSIQLENDLITRTSLHKKELFPLKKSQKKEEEFIGIYLKKDNRVLKYKTSEKFKKQLMTTQINSFFCILFLNAPF